MGSWLGRWKCHRKKRDSNMDSKHRNHGVLIIQKCHFYLSCGAVIDRHQFGDCSGDLTMSLLAINNYKHGLVIGPPLPLVTLVISGKDGRTGWTNQSKPVRIPASDGRFWRVSLGGIHQQWTCLSTYKVICPLNLINYSWLYPIVDRYCIVSTIVVFPLNLTLFVLVVCRLNVTITYQHDIMDTAPLLDFRSPVGII